MYYYILCTIIKNAAIVTTKWLTCSSSFAVGFAGTPGYLSPEVLRKDPYGKPVDMWACGKELLWRTVFSLILKHLVELRERFLTAFYQMFNTILYLMYFSINSIMSSASTLIFSIVVYYLNVTVFLHDLHYCVREHTWSTNTNIVENAIIHTSSWVLIMFHYQSENW